MQPVSLTDQNFAQEVLQSKLPVLVDVWSDGCAPCMQLEPIVMDLAARYEGRLKVAELHASRAPRTLARLGVRGTPTVLYFKAGREVERVVGFRGSLYHRDFIENELLEAGAAV
ncbi:MAG: thioredoxin [Deltaproteobacteria bacterium]|nr:thioredoxin [Deltaproteobacteria bacterium]